ncbi:MAG TPA: PhnD/SsuA/transferrin family substrate-binding protein [Gemmataceae bacterium]|jgi:ABC-type phosphate/phosphonate transport system substrate-binding protein|nr:PhnD/SsuA/transferrin family substrate-binding protein [Gemmataceae bacterium]
MDRRELLLTLPAVGLAAATAGAGEKDPIVVVIMDPLAAPLSCPCVKGYAQRDYDKLGAYISKKVGRPVHVHYSETLAGSLLKKTDGKADVIIGKDSVIRAEAKLNKLEVTHVAALTGKDGSTTQKGLIVVPKDDPAKTVEDLKGYKIVFGPSTADEKYSAAMALLKDLGVPIPAKLETCSACSDGATTVLELHKNGEKAATVISSYAQPLLEGCGTIKKGDLRVVGETDPVPFVAAFVTGRLSGVDRDAVKAALLEIGKDKDLCVALETKDGFVTPPTDGAKKK